MGSHHYLYLTSEDSKETHPENNSFDFTVELPRSLTLEGDWECSLKELGFSNQIKSDFLYICSDICEESLACDTVYPILRVIYNDQKRKWKALTFQDPFYIKLRRQNVSRIRIFIRGRRLEPLVTENTLLKCTVHLRKAS